MKKLIILFVLLLFIQAPLSFAQNTRAYILGEGGGTPGSGKLSSYTYAGNSFNQSIFSPGNIGLYPDGLMKFNSNLFLLEQGGFGGQGKIYKLDSNGTVITSQAFGTNPYSLTAANNKIYTTNGPAHSVLVLDASNFSVLKTITVGVYPQEIFAYQNKVFVCNMSLFGGNADSTVSVINAFTDSVIATIHLNDEPSSIALSNDNKLLIGCASSEGKIYKVDPNTFAILDSYTVMAGFDRDLSVDKNSNNVYFINYFNDIIKLDLVTRVSSVLIANPNPAASYFYGYNFDYTNNKHFVLDAKNFLVSGSLYIYSLTGTLEQTFATGVAPRRVIFDRTSTVDVRFISEVVKGYELKQNYPNPFNPETSIRFSIPKNEFVNLKVYDINGREIENLVNETKQAGTYEVNFNASSLSSGMYFYKITTSSFTSIKKMTLVK